MFVTFYPCQVFKTGVPHYFSIERARRDFEYNPEPRTLDGVVRWFRERGHGRPPAKRSQGLAAKTTSRLWTFFVNILLAVAIIALIMSLLPMVN